MDEILGPRCGCQDCEAAVSPGAYLADLLDYALKHVRNNGAKIELSFLELRFHQPFTELPIDCAAVDRNVRQVRLAVEVLRDYIGLRPLFESAREQTLFNSEAAYRLAAYTRLLTQFGTTYEEVRRARSAVADPRSELALRLGIDLTPPDPGMPRQDELDQLFLDAALPAKDARALTERVLERVFGLGDTGRDRLSDGVKYGDDQEQITRWNFNGAYWNRNTDADGVIYLSIFKLAADAYAVYAYSDSARNRLVAGGERKTAAGPIRLVPENGSGLSGVVEIDYKADDTDISLSLVPLVLGWRLRHLRTTWKREDWPVDPPVSDAAEPLPPLIDPQVISLNDLRSARPGEPAFDLWLDRFNWLINQRQALKSKLETAASQLAGLETIIAQALSTPARAVTVADLDALDEAQKRGERIEQRLRPLGFTPGGFAFLMPILAIARSGQPIVGLEWEAVYDTLLCARKLHEFPAWRTEEANQKLTLSPDHFRIGDDASAPEQATSLSVPLWLSTREARRGWVEVLEARIAQETAVGAGLESAVSSVEESALPLLRDALLVASDAEGGSSEERAEWLTQRLLIDFRMSGSQLTTRVAQAIETLQELLFSLRTGQLEQDTLSAFAPLASICAVAQGDRRIDLFGRGEDNLLWHRVWDGRWRSWRSCGALPGAESSSGPSDPTVVAWANGRLDLIVRSGGDTLAKHVLWHRQYDHERWFDWERVEGDLELHDNPASVFVEPGEVYVFALRNDRQVMQRRYDGTIWTAWEVNGETSQVSPAATSWGADRLDLFIGLLVSAPNQLLHRWWDGAAWHDDPIDALYPFNPAAASSDVNRLDVFQNRSGHLWQKSFDGAWHPWVDLDAVLGAGDPKLEAVPAVYSRLPGTLDVFAIRAGGVWSRGFAANAWSDWEELPSDKLTLMADDFDAEWKWIGSYTTWRSATFVRLYPDNLLLPSLITHQTPAFQTLVKQTRPTQRLTPDQACTMAGAYSSYLRDVSSLEIWATCEVLTSVDKNDPCKTAAPISKHLLYMFGRTTWGKVYWSALDRTDRSGFAQSFWAEVPLAPKVAKAPTVKVVKIIGALPWLNRHLGQHHIYLFLDVDEPSGRKLKRIRFDLDRYGREDAWEADVTELSDLPTYKDPSTKTEKPDDVKFLTILPVQSDSVVDPPRLAVHAHLSSLNAYIRPLNAAGDGWEGAAGDWQSYQIDLSYAISDFSTGKYTINMLEAALHVNQVTWLVYDRDDKMRHASAIPDTIGRNRYDWDVCDSRSHFGGALPGNSSDSSIFLFYDDAGQTIYREFKPATGPGTAFIPDPRLHTLAPHSGSLAPTFFVTSYAYRCQAVNGELIGSSKLQVVPVLGSVHNIPVGESMLALQSRRISIKSVYQWNKGASASILTYLAEAYRLVPLQLALNMQSSGEYVAALDWFTTVYDYRAQQGERYIDYGLEIDAGLPATAIFRHPEDWLLDPLNPHAVALTRRYAYTRFTIASIIRCLNDFADAEFTQDTDESLVRARLLYTTALELCDVPELRQHLNACDALIGELKIQPGELVPPEVAAALGEIAEELTQGRLGGAPHGLLTLEKMKLLVQSGKAWETIVPELKVMKQEALKAVPVPFKADILAAERPEIKAKAYSQLLTDPGVEQTVQVASEVAISEATALMGAGGS